MHAMFQDPCNIFISIDLHTNKNKLITTQPSLWRHQMETFPRYCPFVRGNHRSVTRTFVVFCCHSKKTSLSNTRLTGNSRRRCNCEGVGLDTHCAKLSYIHLLITGWSRPSNILVKVILVEVIACHLLGTKHLLEPLMTYWPLDPTH